MRQPPTGTVTFLFTDIEGSTILWEIAPDAMRPALARHDHLLHQAITRHGGHVFKTVGDAFCAAFDTAADALNTALAVQQSVAAEPWGTPVPLRVRVALHTGSAEERGGDYYGPTLNRVARLMSSGHGGQVLISAATQELTRDHLSERTGLRDLGDARLKDLSRPEHVFQLLHPSLPADFPPLRSLESVPNNLPQQATSFIGRERETGEVRTLLAKTRLLTLTGAGGCGKTRLALQVAADSLDQFSDGVWLAEMAPLADPTLVPQAVAGVLGVKEAAGKTIQKSLLEWMKPKRLLLILDNCEHLVAACASLAADTLRHCPEVRLLASSREPLAIAGEQTYRVPSLSLPDPNARGAQTAQSLSQYEAVRLFIERAQAVRPSFSVTDRNAPAVAQVCFHLDGIPLAIELAAARVRSLPVEQINARLGQRFRLLTGGARGALPRQQTLRALVDWSYDLLTPSEKALLCRLSVFVGGWVLPAAEAVCSGDGIEDWEMLDLLTSLVDKSLAVYEERGGGEARYGLLETVRQYAGDWLAEGGEAASVRDGHLSWYTALAEEAQPRLSGPDQVAWLSRLEAEHDNLRAGLAWAESSAGTAERGLRLAGALWQFWDMRGQWSEGRGHLAASLAREGIGGGTRERARALNGLGRLTDHQGDLADALPLYERARAISREVADRQGEASILMNLGLVKLRLSDLEAAHALWEQALAISREIGDRRGEGNSLKMLGVAARERSDWERAGSYYERARAISREVADQQGEASILVNLGVVREAQGDLEAARSLWEQALVIYRESRNRGSEANVLMNLGVVEYARGDLEAARSLWEQAVAISREIGDKLNEAGGLSNLGLLARDQGRLAQAGALFAQSLSLKRRIGDAWSICYTLEEWAALAQAEGNASRAARLAGAASAGRDAVTAPLPPDQENTHTRTLSAARTALGDDGFAAAWDAGRAMTLDEAVEYGLRAG